MVCVDQHEIVAPAPFLGTVLRLTQVDRQIQTEITPLLLKNCLVSTLIATLNAYVDIIRPVHRQT